MFLEFVSLFIFRWSYQTAKRSEIFWSRGLQLVSKLLRLWKCNLCFCCSNCVCVSLCFCRFAKTATHMGYHPCGHWKFHILTLNGVDHLAYDTEEGTKCYGISKEYGFWGHTPGHGMPSTPHAHMNRMLFFLYPLFRVVYLTYGYMILKKLDFDIYNVVT